MHLLFVPQYASHLYRSAPPICTGVTSEKIPGVGGSGKFLIVLSFISSCLCVCSPLFLSPGVILCRSYFNLLLQLASALLLSTCCPVARALPKSGVVGVFTIVVTFYHEQGHMRAKTCKGRQVPSDRKALPLTAVIVL